MEVWRGESLSICRGGSSQNKDSASASAEGVIRASMETFKPIQGGVRTRVRFKDWIETEEKGKRLAIGKGDGETTLSFEVANPSLETQAYYLGGTVKNEGGKKSYSPPKNKPVVEKSFKLVTKQGFDIEIPNGKVTATPLSGQIGTDSVMTMKIKISVQEPEKAGVDWIRYCEK